MKHPLAVHLFFILLVKSISSLNEAWRWECVEGFCQKQIITPETEKTAQSLAECRLFCSTYAALWPKPTGNIQVHPTLSKINVNSIDIEGVNYEKPNANLAKTAFKRFQQQISNLTPQKSKRIDGGASVIVTYNVANPDVIKLSLSIDESYSLKVTEGEDGRINVDITAENTFGARHGLETLIQLVIYDDLRDEVKMPKNITITDKPAYSYRGILLDTSRNYVTVDAIKRTIEGMAMTKLNRFHWHITDSHSFPFVSASLPELSKLGAYNSKKVYTAEDVEDIVQFAVERGVAVVPEFDAPAHVGEGWQNTDFVVCFNAKPWLDYCVEPPCGQFDPTKEKLYDTLEALYGDMVNQFQPDIFHMGGDEVHFGCWNSTEGIINWMLNEKGWGRTEEDFVKLWDFFQSQALERLYNKTGKEIDVIMWTSTLTHPEYLKYLPNEKYIIQIWSTGTDPQISNLLNKGYRVILSNYDALYLDCGFGGWVNDGNNWCSPYIGWHKVYANTPAKIAGDKKGQIMGAEATLWSEQADTANIDSRLWPRASAMGEVLWSEPEGTWRQAEARILAHRERLVQNGINADAIEPEWCWQNEEHCPITDINPTTPVTTTSRETTPVTTTSRETTKDTTTPINQLTTTQSSAISTNTVLSTNLLLILIVLPTIP